MCYFFVSKPHNPACRTSVDPSEREKIFSTLSLTERNKESLIFPKFLKLLWLFELNETTKLIFL